MNKQRLEWIDVCKGILIITIVLTHINCSFWTNNPIGEYFSNFTSLYKVSIFFCVAGLTLKDEKLKDTLHFILGKIKNLWVKVVIIGLAAVFLHNALISIGFYELGTDYAGKTMVVYRLTDFLKQLVLTLFMANREVIIGPMWYAYVLFMALMILCVLDWLIRKFIKVDGSARKIRFIVALILMLISSILTNIVDLTIPRFNNTLTAVFLIDFCQFLYRELKCAFSSKWIFTISIFVFLNLPLYGHFSMNNNYFENPAFLIVVAICGMYSLYYISQKISMGTGKILSFIGRQSFWIMALQFASFKVGSCILNIFGNVKNVASLTPTANNVFEMLFYVVAGVVLPCIFGAFIDKVKMVVNSTTHL